MSKLIIIDGMNWLCRYSHRSLKVVRGEIEVAPHSLIPNGAIKYFLKGLTSIIKLDSPRYILVHFDGKDPYRSRRRIDPSYKSEKSIPTDELLVEIRNISLLLEELGIRCLRYNYHEIADVLNCVIPHFESEEIIIYSHNKSLFRFVSDRVLIFNRQEKKLYDRASVKQEISICPDQIADFTALAGNKYITGVPGIGKLSAFKILRDIKPIEELWVNFDRLSSHFQKKLLEGKSKWETSQQLLALKGNFDLPVKDKFVSRDIKLPQSELGKYLIEELGVKNEVEELVKQSRVLPLWQEKREIVKQKAKNIPQPNL